MSLSNVLYNFKNTKDIARREKSNPKKKSFDDSSAPQTRFYAKNAAAENATHAEMSGRWRYPLIVFKRNMKEKNVRREIFILEGEERFEQMTIRAKMTELAHRGDTNLKNWYYEMGINDKLPESWSDFKKAVIEYCTSQSLDSIFKFKEESWSQYCIRLKNFCELKNILENDIFKKLRKEYAPKAIQMILYSIDNDFNKLLERIQEFESFGNDRNTSFQNKNKEVKPLENKRKMNKENVKCFKCNFYGHYANECKEKEKSLNLVDLKNTDDKSLDKEAIKIQGREIFATFDTGASESVVTSKVLTKLRNIKLEKTDKNFKLINGHTINVKNSVELKFEYKKKFYNEKFNVVENKHDAEILLSNFMVKKLRNKYLVPVECVIDTKDAPPVSWSRPIKSQKDKEEFQVLVKDLEMRGIIEASKSCWLNPVVLARKRNGKLRFCIDFRRLNDLVDLDGYEIPRIRELISQLRDKRYFTSIDLKDGFFQIHIRELDKEKTTFYTGERLMQFKMMPQGFKNSPAIFQRSLDLILGELKGKSCLAYIDDILVFGKDLIEHDANLGRVLERLKKYDLEENLEKRVERKENIKFLGFEISLNKIQPSTQRAQGIIGFPEPKTRKELQRFLGLINYDRQFIKNITTWLKPFYRLLEKEKKFLWSKNESLIFSKVKDLWKKSLELTIPDMKQEFQLETDASQSGIGAVLKQKDTIIAFISRSLTKSEQNYGITEKETLAALWAMEKMQYFLLGRKFKLITDHEAIKYIDKKIDFGSQRIHRWFERFQRFTFDVEYRKGSEMIAADALSRAPATERGDDCKESNLNTLKSFRKEKRKCTEMNTSTNFPKIKNKQINQAGDDIRKKILQVHGLLNHRKNIREELKKQKIYISESDLRKTLSTCFMCAKKDKKYYTPAFHIKTTRVGELVGVDLLEIGPRDLVILAIDYFSRKIFGKAVTTKHSYKILNFIKELHEKFPIETLITDNGREFDNDELKNFCMNNSINHKLSVPHYHASNGRIERANRTIRTALKKTKGCTKTKLTQVLDNYNNFIHRAIKMSPNDAIKNENKKVILANYEKYAKEFLRKRKNNEVFNEGEKVLIRNEAKNNKMDDEFKYKGVIQKKLSGNIYEVLNNRNKVLKRHSSQLKRLYEGDVVDGSKEIGKYTEFPSLNNEPIICDVIREFERNQS